jgi:hypothetical protein
MRDSHVRGCSARLKDKLNGTYNVMGIVKPGTGIKILTSMGRRMGNLTVSDVRVLWGGTNDVSHNKLQEGLKHLMNFVQSNSHTNIIIMSVPHRYDLTNWSCVNRKVTTFNQKLQKLMKPFKHVVIITTDLTRGHFTRHGLHMNSLGKDLISSIISMAIKEILVEKKETTPIMMPWKRNYTGDYIESQGFSMEHHNEFSDNP